MALLATPATWFPDNGLELMMSVAGLFVAFLFVFSAWRGPATPAQSIDLKADPRVKSFFWGLTGFVVALINAWKPILGQEPLQKSRLFYMYGVPFIGGSGLGVAATAAMIWVKCLCTKRFDLEHYPDEPFSPVLEYLHDGYRRYSQEYERRVALKREERLARFRRISAEAATLLAAAILAVERYERNPTAALRKTVVQQILEHICLVARGLRETASHAIGNANLMVAVPFARATEEQKRLMKFSWGDTNRYAYLLVLDEYAYPTGREHFALPVEDKDKNPHWEDSTLLGAPEAFLRGKELLVRTDKLDFAKSVPNNVREEIHTYFRTKSQFKSFACLIVLAEGSPAGIVNVESEEEDVLQGPEEIQNQIAQLFQPFCAALSLAIRVEPSA